MSKLPLVGLTMGDPAGVGPEVCLRALADKTISDVANLLVFGDLRVLERCREAIGIDVRLDAVTLDELRHNKLCTSSATIVDFQFDKLANMVPGITTAVTGDASFQFIQRAIDAALDQKIAAVVTAPINKEALQAAKHFYPGHTEMFAERCFGKHKDRWCMMQFSPEITCTFATVHCGYDEVPRLLTIDRICDVIELTAEAMWKIHRREPRLVVCGLNPHAGEHGLFGHHEEEMVIVPAIERSRSKGIIIDGPLPADTAFVPARRQNTDAFVCMYHDQGHIPVKALAFDSAVNTTLGISVVRN